MEQLPVYEETVAACATRRDLPQHAWRTPQLSTPPAPKPSPRPRPKAQVVERPHEWSVPATVLRIVSGDLLFVDADLGWRSHIQTCVHLYGVTAGPDHEAQVYISTVAEPGTTVTLTSHRLLEPCDGHPMVLASVTLPDGRDLSTLLLARDLVKPGRVD